jgi:anti-anti-sigma factor
MPPDLDNHLISISRIRVVHDQEVSCVRFRGAVRKLTEASFRDTLREAGRRAPHLLVDLSEVAYLSSSGLGLLLEQAGTQEREEGWLRLVSPSQTVSMILRLSGTAEALAWFAEEDAALDDLRGRAA